MNNETVSDNNRKIAEYRTGLFNKRKGIRVGDFLKLRNGHYLRFSHDWGKDIQTSRGGSFYFGNGCCDFSGGLYGAVYKKLLVKSAENRMGTVWFFNNNEARAHNGIYIDIEFRVFEFSDEAEETNYLKKTWLDKEL